MCSPYCGLVCDFPGLAAVARLVSKRTGLVDTLANRVGEKRLYRALPVASDVPVRSTTRVAAMAPAAGESWLGHWRRPARLRAAPEPIETVALLPDHPLVTFTWRGVRRP